MYKIHCPNCCQLPLYGLPLFQSLKQAIHSPLALGLLSQRFVVSLYLSILASCSLSPLVLMSLGLVSMWAISHEVVGRVTNVAIPIKIIARAAPIEISVVSRLEAV